MAEFMEQPLLDAGQHTASTGIRKDITDKSLFLCMVLPNPAHESFKDKSVVKDKRKSFFRFGRDDVKEEPEDPEERENGQLLDDDFPLDKKIQIIQERLRREFPPLGLHLDIYDDERSPDDDEIYVRIHADENLLKQFAEQNQIVMRTLSERHPKKQKFLRGAPEPYSAAREEEVGFEFGPPQKQRMLIRLLKTPQEFGGCGLQIDELRKDSVIRGFFPLHNSGLVSYGLEEWADLRKVQAGLNQPYDKICRYFGEKIGLYFFWMGSYTRAMSFPAVAGIIVGTYGLVTGNSQNAGLAIFAVLLVAWAIAWDVLWERKQTHWAHEFGCDIETQHENLRDGFRHVGKRPIRFDADKLEFAVPLMAFRKGDTSYEYYYPSWRRVAAFFFVSVPVIAILIGSLLVCLIFITKWRFENADNTIITTAASAITVTVMVIFNLLYDRIAHGLNWLENHRTDTDYENALIQKSFLYYFCNAYSALFIIAVYPVGTSKACVDKWGTDAEGLSQCQGDERIEQLSSQMLIILAIKPMIQNLVEILMPYLKTKYRRWNDARGQENRILTKTQQQASREPYETPMSDYLEIAIQFGYMSMFACVFPWGPAISMLYNVLEIRIDARKLVIDCQRPKADVVQSIGAWGAVFKVLTVCAAASNAYIICFLSHTFQNPPYNMSSDGYSRALSFIVSQYTLFGIVTVVYFGFPHVPVTTLKMRAAQLHLQHEERVEMLKHQARAHDHTVLRADGGSHAAEKL
eukprot:TRINITY_DN93043_c0_g1_i1.p1 TRINITY_DN93043_c0_g1~~TRINITY_DN93043_c0_g1_i1.p1  ORF type:complete len:746 (-),score=137.61 TRINITY_DN93043_c0_g1_i1:101-2338(-)